MKTKNLKNRIKRGMSMDDNTYAILKRLASDDKVSVNDILETLVLTESNKRILNGSKVETFINADIVEENVYTNDYEPQVPGTPVNEEYYGHNTLTDLYAPEYKTDLIESLFIDGNDCVYLEEKDATDNRLYKDENGNYYVELRDEVYDEVNDSYNGVVIDIQYLNEELVRKMVSGLVSESDIHYEDVNAVGNMDDIDYAYITKTLINGLDTLYDIEVKAVKSNDEDGCETETYYDDEEIDYQDEVYDDECNDAGYVEENEVRERTLIDELYEEVYSEETIDWLYNVVFANGEVLKHISGTYYVFENVEYEDGTTSRETYLLNGETLKEFALENVEEELTLALNDDETLDDIDWDYVARTFIEGLEG